MPDILDVIDAVVATQEAITATRPSFGTIAVKKAWPYSPPQGQLVVPPAFTNSWDLGERRTGPSQNLDLTYVIHMQFYAGQATNGDDSRTAAIATAFMPAIQAAFGQRNADGYGGFQLYGLVGETLQATCTIATLRGGTPTLAVIERGGAAYIGLDLFLDVRMNQTFAHS